MYFKMNAYLWFILSCAHGGQSQQRNLTAWNVCQRFPPFSGNSLLPSSTQVVFGFLQFPYPCLWKCQLAGIICWRSYRFLPFLTIHLKDNFSSYSFLPLFHRTGKNKNTMKRRHKSESMLLPFHMQMLYSKKLKIQKEVFLSWQGIQKAPHGIYFYSKRNAIFLLFL